MDHSKGLNGARHHSASASQPFKALELQWRHESVERTHLNETASLQSASTIQRIGGNRVSVR
jgi:hypothetical protein